MKVFPFLNISHSCVHPGEILVQRTRFSGYHDDDNANQSKWVNGWYCTGDIGERIGEHSIRVGEKISSFSFLFSVICSVSRASDVTKLSNGRFVSLSRLEEVREKEKENVEKERERR